MELITLILQTFTITVIMKIVVGKALTNKRNKIILASKVGNVTKNDGSPGFNWDPSKKHILESIHGSLKRLNTEYIDLYHTWRYNER